MQNHIVFEIIHTTWKQISNHTSIIMSTTTKPSSKKTNIRRDFTPDDIHRQQHAQPNSQPNSQPSSQPSSQPNSQPSSQPNSQPSSATSNPRPPLTPAEKAAKEARKAKRAAKRAADAAKEAKEAEEKQSAEANTAPPTTMRKRYLKGEPLIKLRDYEIFVISELGLKEFIRDVPIYPINNPIDYHHWRQIGEGIRQITTLDNSINVVEYDDGSIQILDGQHRKYALMNLPDEVLLKKEVSIHLYRSDTYNSQRTIKLFNRFNTLKPFKIEHDITEAIIIIITRLRVDCKGFGYDAIKQTDNDTARQPAMSMKQFSSCLEPLLHELGPGNYEPNDIVKHINDINQEYAVQFAKEHTNRLFKGEPPKNDKKRIDMLRIQFYLNTELSKSEWPKRLLEKLRL